MTANPWILAIHLIALFVWIAHMIMTPRVLAFAVTQNDDERLRWAKWLQRSWNVLSPAALVVIGAGFLMMFGVGSPGSEPLSSIGTYLAPRQNDEPSFWYISFHVKLVSATLLMCSDFWLRAQIVRIARNEEAKSRWAMCTLMGIGMALVSHVTVWLTLAAAGMGYNARFVGYVFALAGMAGGIYLGRRLGRTDKRAKYMAMHGLIMALIILIVIVVIAKPLIYGGATLD